MPTSPQQQRPSTSHNGELRSLALSSVGILMVVSVAIGAGIGLWVDERLGTDPWFTVAGVVFGTAAGFHEMWRLVRASETCETPSDPPGDDPDLRDL